MTAIVDLAPVGDAPADTAVVLRKDTHAWATYKTHYTGKSIADATQACKEHTIVAADPGLEGDATDGLEARLLTKAGRLYWLDGDGRDPLLAKRALDALAAKSKRTKPDMKNVLLRSTVNKTSCALYKKCTVQIAGARSDEHLAQVVQDLTSGEYEGLLAPAREPRVVLVNYKACLNQHIDKFALETAARHARVPCVLYESYLAVVLTLADGVKLKAFTSGTILVSVFGKACQDREAALDIARDAVERLLRPSLIHVGGGPRARAQS